MNFKLRKKTLLVKQKQQLSKYIRRLLITENSWLKRSFSLKMSSRFYIRNFSLRSVFLPFMFTRHPKSQIYFNLFSFTHVILYTHRWTVSSDLYRKTRCNYLPFQEMDANGSHYTCSGISCYSFQLAFDSNEVNASRVDVMHNGLPFINLLWSIRESLMHHVLEWCSFIVCWL